MNCRYAIFTLVLVGFASASGVLEAQSAVPDSVARRIDAVFTKFGPDSPGCALGVYRDGRIVYDRGYGSADLERKVPLSPASVLDIGSTSKQFTAMSILLLQQDGKLSLNDDIRTYLPELPDYGTRITIGDMLHHISGLRDYTTLLVLAGNPTENWTTDQDALDILARQRGLNFKPGSEWQYSNSGFFLLSIIVKRVSGQSIRRFAQSRIFGPLGMTHTHIHDDHTMVVPNRAIGYIPSDSGGPFRIEMSDWEQAGDGSVLTTVEDLVKWDENFYTGRVGGPSVLAEMVKPGKLATGKVLDYASGLFLGEYRGLKIVEHGGAWAGYRAQLMRFPTEHVSVACLCNLGTAGPTELVQRVADVYLADRLQPAPKQAATASDTVAGAGSPVLPPERLQDAVGTYRNAKLGEVGRIALLDGQAHPQVRRRVLRVAAGQRHRVPSGRSRRPPPVQPRAGRPSAQHPAHRRGTRPAGTRGSASVPSFRRGSARVCGRVFQPRAGEYLRGGSGETGAGAPCPQSSGDSARAHHPGRVRIRRAWG